MVIGSNDEPDEIPLSCTCNNLVFKRDNSECATAMYSWSDVEDAYYEFCSASSTTTVRAAESARVGPIDGTYLSKGASGIMIKTRKSPRPEGRRQVSTTTINVASAAAVVTAVSSQTPGGKDFATNRAICMSSKEDENPEDDEDYAQNTSDDRWVKKRRLSEIEESRLPLK
uniref:Uncharacterized protein n=1 Tax=Romanomermis culicivorax TaxID=13658 RepID=A0A915K2R2_ROMCU